MCYYFNKELWEDTSEKQVEFEHSILSKQNFNLDLKLAALSFLFAHHCKEFLEKNSDFPKNIETMIRLRNTVAHRRYDHDLSDLDKEQITFVHRTTESKKIKIVGLVMSPDELDKFHTNYMRAHDQLIEAGELLVGLRK
jgi:hypothetical protein